MNLPDYLGKNGHETALLYLGDNPTKGGNDWDPYVAAGFEHSIAVPNPGFFKEIPVELAGHVVPGNDHAIDLIFKAILHVAEKEQKEEGQSFAFTPKSIKEVLKQIQKEEVQ